ncbi:hypothetical protein F5Y16DRAFT_391535, partial [Xylariaceae sp. FL0255]
MDSPFDALGLDPGIYTQQQIQEAFKKASLICHPDKRNYYQLSSTRWPTVEHLQSARSRLREDCAAALEHFSTFPRTFFPESKPFFKLPGSLNHPFAACPICCMVLHAGGLPEHLLGDHDQRQCPLCPNVISVNDIQDHCAEAHDRRICRYCERIFLQSEIQGHLAAKHFCDLCREKCQSLLQHLESNHALKPCQECETTDDLARHINESELHL